jgi:hypothetical protein
MIDRVRLVIMACPMLAFVLAGVAQSQNLEHPLTRGTVTDILNHPLEQAEVVVRDSASRIVTNARTDSDGTYILHGLDPNTPYNFIVRKIGFVPDSGTLMIPQVAGSQARVTASADFMLQTIVPRLDTVNVAAKKTHSIFGKLGNAFDKINSGLDWFDKTLNKYCHSHSTGINGISLCVDPNGVGFAFSWKPPIGDGPLGGGILFPAK